MREPVAPADHTQEPPMSDATENTTTISTLGQRIDAVLGPLYAEAEQHRAAIEQTRSQIQTLQQQAESATQGLARLEGQMAEVVRSLANQDPVLAAVVGGAVTPAESSVAPAGPTTTPDSAPSTSGSISDTPTLPHESETTPTATDVTELKPEPTIDAQPAATTVTPLAPDTTELATGTDVPINSESDPDTEPETVPLDLDPETDQAMVEEAADLLAAAPADPPPADIAAVAERAAQAAKQIKQQAASAQS